MEGALEATDGAWTTGEEGFCSDTDWVGVLGAASFFWGCEEEGGVGYCESLKTSLHEEHQQSFHSRWYFGLWGVRWVLGVCRERSNRHMPNTYKTRLMHSKGLPSCSEHWFIISATFRWQFSQCPTVVHADKSTVAFSFALTKSIIIFKRFAHQ